MSVLDLQGMHTPEPAKGPPAGSRASKGCNNNTNNGGTIQSNVSLLLCTVVL